jgi:Tfp pilus assembly protein PilV
MKKSPASRNSRAGFTIIEVMAATILFALSIFAIVQSQSGSRRAVSQSERLFSGIMLAQSKMAEQMLKVQAEVDKNGVEASYKEDQGTFEAPHTDFKWKMSFKESEFKLGPEEMSKYMQTMGVEEEEAERQVETQRLMLTNLAKMIKENYGELRVVVEWDHYGSLQTLPLVTHIAPKKPKIQFTTVAE